MQPSARNRLKACLMAAAEAARLRRSATSAATAGNELLEHEPRHSSSSRDDRQPRTELSHHAELAAQVLDGAGELLALGLDLSSYLRRRARLGRHQRFNASVVSLASRIACSGTGGVPFLIRLRAAAPRMATSPNRISVTTRSASHVERN